MKDANGKSSRLDARTTEILNAELESMIGDRGTCVPGLGVIVYRDGQEVYSRFLGRRVIGATPAEDRSMTRESRFRIASVSKMFTVFTLLQLEEQGRLSLKEDVSRYLGFSLRNPVFPAVPITVEMLAGHTSSLRDGRVYSISPEKGLEEFFSPEGEFWEGGGHFGRQAPGEYFTYCNLNYGVLGTVIEAVTGQRFDLYQKEHILQELEIGGDYVPGNFSPEEFRLLGTCYQKKDVQGRWDEYGPWRGTADAYGGVQPPAETLVLQNPYAEDVRDFCSLRHYRPGRNATIFSPTGGLRISCGELAHALEMLMGKGVYRGKRVLSTASAGKMLERHWIYDENRGNGDTCGGAILSYGLGIYPMDGSSTARLCRNREINLTGHAGEAFGLLSMLCFRPGTGDGFVYIMNGEALEEDEDSRSLGEFSSNYIWEEKLGDAVCRNMFSK